MSLAKAAAPGKSSAPTLLGFKPDSTATTVGLGGTSFHGLACPQLLPSRHLKESLIGFQVICHWTHCNFKYKYKYKYISKFKSVYKYKC